MAKTIDRKCYARWIEHELDVCFRDQTILQFGGNWTLRASFILHNPGSATPISDDSQNAMLAAKRLPFFVPPEPGEHYVEFRLDPLMRSLIDLISAVYPGGTIKIFNLFNLKNADSGEAASDYRKYDHPRLFTRPADIQYANAPVVVATGNAILNDPTLRRQFDQYISAADKRLLFAVVRNVEKQYTIKRTTVKSSGLVESFHPTYTHKYGNKTTFAGFK